MCLKASRESRPQVLCRDGLIRAVLTLIWCAAMDVFMPIDNLRIVGEVDNDVGSFSWALWLKETELRQHEHMIKRIIDSALPKVSPMALDSKERPVLMKDAVAVLAKLHGKTKYEVFVWMNTGAGQPFDLLHEFRVGIRLVKENVTSEAQMASRIARKAGTPFIAIPVA